MACMSSYGIKQNIQLADAQLAQIIYQMCYNILATDGIAKEQSIRNDNYIFQRTENTVLMYMVVTITVSGVILAGLQLLGSYKLALAGKPQLTEGGQPAEGGQFAVGGQLNLSMHNIALKSSVVGVIILGISFAFFLVFVLYVYTLKDASNGREAAASAAISSPLPANTGVGVPRQLKPAEKGGQ